MRPVHFFRGILVISSILFFSNAMVSQSASNATPGQQPAARPAATQASESQRTAKKKSNKVWTNEDVGGLTGNVSVVGDSVTPEKNSSKAEQTENPPTNAKDAAWYKTQLAPLYSQLESVERQIQELKNFKGNNASPEGGIQYGGRYNMTPAEQQVKQLEAKKKSLQSNIDDLESDARHHGIERGELR